MVEKKAQHNDDINDELTNKRIEETYDHDLPSRGNKYRERAHKQINQLERKRVVSVCMCLNASDFSLFFCQQFVSTSKRHLSQR